MVSYRMLQREYLGNCCRTCINQKFNIDLEPKDCEYLYYPYQCRLCGGQKNIVTSVRMLSRYKLFGGKSKD